MVKNTSAPITSTTPADDEIKSAEFDSKVAAARQTFFMSALNMSWQLAVVVLVPVIGGAQLDEARDSAPAFTLLGFVIASVGLALVLWRQLKVLSPESEVKGSSK